MNKLKHAIAYLISKIETAYHATRFFLSLLTLEFPYDWKRMGSKTRGEALPVRKTDFRPNTFSVNRPSAIASPTISVDVAGKNQHPLGATPNISCDGLFSFSDGDFAHGVGDTTSHEPATVERYSTEGIQGGKAADQKSRCDREWDLLEPRDRQAIILDVMRDRQAQLDYYELFSVWSIMDLCDREEMQWEQTFEDLLFLQHRRRVVICETFDERTKKFYGFSWGLK